MAALGMAVTVAILLRYSRTHEIYADYATASLPLVFVSAGAFAQLCGEAAAGARRLALTWGSALVIAAGMLPSTVSHLSDGMRYDYRPAFRRIAADAPDRLVVTWPIVIQRQYAPQLRAAELIGARQLDSLLTRERDLWAVLSLRRSGIVADGSGELARWVAANCRDVDSYERPRIDFREYRVELVRCTLPGEGAPAGGQAADAPAAESRGRGTTPTRVTEELGKVR
jgi:hypothetical protein